MKTKTHYRLVATCGPDGKALLDGARLAPKPPPMVTAADVHKHGKRG